MAKIEFTIECKILIQAIRRAQGEMFVLMFDEMETDFETTLGSCGISIQEDED